MKIPRKRFLIFHKLVSKSNNLLKISISLKKMKKPIIPKLVFIKKSSRKLKRLKLLKHYNYGFIGEYQFESPLTTPLIHYYNTKHHELQKKSIRNIYSMLFWCKCFGCFKAQVRGEADSKLTILEAYLPGAAVGEEKLYLEEDDDHSIDEKAERFIESFYAEMRLQRQESF